MITRGQAREGRKEEGWREELEGEEAMKRGVGRRRGDEERS